MNSVVRIALAAVALLGTLVGVGAIALHYLPVTRPPLVSAAALVPVLTAGPLVALVLGVARRRWLATAVAAAVLAGTVAVQVPRFLPDEGPAPQLTVAASNLKVGGGEVGVLAALVRERRVDVLIVVELTPSAAAAVSRSTIADDLPHLYARPAELAYGSGIYSRYPLSETATVPGFAIENLTAVVEVPGRGAVRLYALHPLPPVPWPPSAWNNRWWADEQAKVRDVLHAAPESMPVIAAGDFNATVDHAVFRRTLTHGYLDAATTVGAGWVRTYPNDRPYPPLVGLDHVLSRGLRAASFDTHDIPGSDHRAVVAGLG